MSYSNIAIAVLIIVIFYITALDMPEPIRHSSSPCEDDLTEISWRAYIPCMSDSSSNSLNWCLRKRKGK